MTGRRAKILFLSILIVAAVLRLWRLDQHDVITDEAFYGYRSIALVDSLNSPYQSTPFEWFEEVPAWAKLSFHDHPPLGFWIWHSFFKVFGINLWALRLPSVLAGIGSVILVFFIAHRLFASSTAGLIASGILAVNQNHIWISRIALQESMVIFFMLLAIWFFLRYVHNSPPPSLILREGVPSLKVRGGKEGLWFYLTVIATALAILMKYTAVILLPVFISFLIWRRRDWLTWKRLILGVILLLVILSPVVIYNLKLYQVRGHFDFQVSYLLKQKVPVWEIRPGREVGDLGDRLANLFIRFGRYYGIGFSILTIFALIAGFWKRREVGLQFIGLVLFFVLALLILVGPQERFLAMLSPPLAMLIASSIWLAGRSKKSVRYFFAVLLILEAGFAVNTNHLITPFGKEGVAYSWARRESEFWGYNQWEEYFLEITKGYYSPQTFPVKFKFAEALQQRAIQDAKADARKAKQILFVIDSRLHGPSNLWYITRHTVFEGWPMISDQNFLRAVSADPNFFKTQGFEETVFLKANETVINLDISAEASENLEKTLVENGKTGEEIRSPQGKIAFRLYRF